MITMDYTHKAGAIRTAHPLGALSLQLFYYK